MTFWDWLWPAGLVAFTILDAIADRIPGATFSTHAEDWFKSSGSKVMLLLLFVTLYGHIAFSASVWPFLGAALMCLLFVLRRYDMSFRWDKWFEGLMVGIVVGAGQVILSAVSDGKVTSTEWYTIAITVVGAGVAWCKDHPPVIDVPSPVPPLSPGSSTTK